MEPIDNTRDGAPIYVAISYKQFYAPTDVLWGPFRVKQIQHRAYHSMLGKSVTI